MQRALVQLYLGEVHELVLVWLTLLLGLGLWVVSLVLLYFGKRTFHRTELIARL